MIVSIEISLGLLFGQDKGHVSCENNVSYPNNAAYFIDEHYVLYCTEVMQFLQFVHNNGVSRPTPKIKDC